MTEQEFITKLPTIDQYYVIFCDFTKMPYVECDVETYDDKIYIFLDKKRADEFVESYKEDKMKLHIEIIKRDQIRNFLGVMVGDGVNMASFRGKEDFDIQLNKIVVRKLKEGAPQPLENPTLQISMIYFMQAVRTAETEEERQITRQFEEEMMVNIARAKLLLPTKVLDETDENGNKRAAIMQLKNENGELYIPLFTDLNEFVKANREEGSFNFTGVDFNMIRSMKLPNMSGFIINPGTIGLLLTEQHMQAIENRFGSGENA